MELSIPSQKAREREAEQSEKGTTELVRGYSCALLPLPARPARTAMKSSNRSDADDATQMYTQLQTAMVACGYLLRPLVGLGLKCLQAGELLP
jgi:hypothetical protein